MTTNSHISPAVDLLCDLNGGAGMITAAGAALRLVAGGIAAGLVGGLTGTAIENSGPRYYAPPPQCWHQRKANMIMGITWKTSESATDAVVSGKGIAALAAPIIGGRFMHPSTTLHKAHRKFARTIQAGLSALAGACESRFLTHN